MHANGKKLRGFADGALEHCLLELTGACNLSCRHCYTGKLPRRNLDADELMRTGFGSRGWIPKKVTLSGGEPLLVDGVLDLAARLRQMGINLLLATNGTAIDQSMARHLAELGFESIYVSILGATAQTHDALCRSNGAFENTVRALRWLLEYGAQVTLRVSVLPENAHEVDAIQNMAALLGVTRVVFNPAVVPAVDGARMPAGAELGDESLSYVLRKLPREPARPKGTCPAAISRIAIGPDGTAYPCHLIRVPAGNLFQQALGEIWENASIFREIRAIGEADHTDCIACPAWGRTCTRRPCRAYLATGSLTSRDPYACREVRLLGEAGADYVAALDARDASRNLQ